MPPRRPPVQNTQPKDGADRTIYRALVAKPADPRQAGLFDAPLPFEGTRLRYAGAVGTGFSEAVAATLRKRLDGLVAARCAVAGLKVAGAVWVSPDLRAEIAFRGRTGSGELRAASFKGLVE